MVDRLYNGSPYAIRPLFIRPVCPVLSVCDVGVLWPNSWMDQDQLGMRVGIGPVHIVLDGDPARPSPIWSS